MRSYKHFGEMIRIKRNECRVTQERLAELSELSTRQIVAIEQGIVNPKLRTAISVCTALEIDIGELKYLTREEIVNV